MRTRIFLLPIGLAVLLQISLADVKECYVDEQDSGLNTTCDDCNNVYDGETITDSYRCIPPANSSYVPDRFCTGVPFEDGLICYEMTNDCSGTKWMHSDVSNCGSTGSQTMDPCPSYRHDASTTDWGNEPRCIIAAVQPSSNWQSTLRRLLVNVSGLATLSWTF